MHEDIVLDTFMTGFILYVDTTLMKIYHGIPWYTKVYHCMPWNTMVYHGISWYIIVYHGIPWFTCFKTQWHTMYLPWYMFIRVERQTRLREPGFKSNCCRIKALIILFHHITTVHSAVNGYPGTDKCGNVNE